MSNPAAVLSDVLQRFQRGEEGRFSAWARAQVGYPNSVWGRTDQDLLAQVKAAYSADALAVLAKEGAAKIVQADLTAVVGQTRADRIWSLFVTPAERKVLAESSPSQPEARKAKFNALHYISFVVLGLSSLYALVVFWKAILGFALLAVAGGSIWLLCMRSTRMIGAGVMVALVIAVAAVGQFMPTNDATAGSASDRRPDLAAESACSLALDRGTMGQASNFGEVVLNNQMTGSRFSADSTLRPDGSYAVKVVNKSDITDSMCPARLVGTCVVNGDNVHVTSPLRRDGYIACG